LASNRDLLRLNVGFIIHQNVGYSRDFPINIPVIHFPPDLNLEELDGTVKVTRAAQGLLLQARLHANAPSECVRCLTVFPKKLVVDFTELYAFTKNSTTELGLMVPESGKIDLEPLVREEMLLAVPISALCRPDCKGLCPVCGENLNESACEHNIPEPDARLEVLKTYLLEKEDPTQV
jgi:uncharacterized protein